METIKNYVDVMFASFPQTADMLEMKVNMLTNLEEKFNSLLEEGLSENEAAGSIIRSVGSTEDLRKELNISFIDEVKESKTADTHIDAELRQEYKNYTKKKSIFVAVAVGLFIISPCLFMLFRDVHQMLALCLFFGVIAIGVALCILACSRDEYYNAIFRISGRNPSLKKHRYADLFASIAFPLGTMIYLFIGLTWNLWHPGWIIFPICGVLTGAIAAIEESFQKDIR